MSTEQMLADASAVTTIADQRDALQTALQALAGAPRCPDVTAAMKAIASVLKGLDAGASRKYAQGRHDAMASLYAWLGEQAKSCFKTAEDNEAAISLDMNVGQRAMGEGMVEVRRHLRKSDKSLAREAIDNI